MEESSTYQAVLNKEFIRGWVEGWLEGWLEVRAESLAESIIRIGRHRFRTEPPQNVVQRLSTIKELAALKTLAVQILDVANWDELSLNCVANEPDSVFFHDPE